MKRTKDKAEVEEKMKDRVATGGKYLKSSLEKADDPVEVILADPDKYLKKLVDGVAEAHRTGRIKSGLEKAKKRGSWKGSLDRAASHFEERTDDMVANALDDYDERKAVIDKAKEEISKMPSTTRTQRIARSTKYQTLVAEGFDKLYGRKA